MIISRIFGGYILAVSTQADIEAIQSPGEKMPNDKLFGKPDDLTGDAANFKAILEAAKTR